MRIRIRIRPTRIRRKATSAHTPPKKALNLLALLNLLAGIGAAGGQEGCKNRSSPMQSGPSQKVRYLIALLVLKYKYC